MCARSRTLRCVNWFRCYNECPAGLPSSRAGVSRDRICGDTLMVLGRESKRGKRGGDASGIKIVPRQLAGVYGCSFIALRGEGPRVSACHDRETRRRQSEQEEVKLNLNLTWHVGP
jgi:hypothetical protein